MSDSQPHDSLFKSIFSHPRAARALLELVGRGSLASLLDLDSLRIESVNFVGDGFGQRFADLVMSARAAGDPVIVHLLFEHKSEAHPLLVHELYTSSAALGADWIRRHREADRAPLVIPVVMFHGTRPFPRERTLRDTFVGSEAWKTRFHDLIPTFPYFLLDLSQVDDSAIRESMRVDIAGGAALWLFKYARREGFEERFFLALPWLGDAFDPAVTARAARSLLRYTAVTMGPRTSASEFIERFERTASPGAGRMARNLLESMIEEGIEKGLERGRQEGRNEGLEIGAIEALRVTVVKILARRFGDLPSRVESVIQGTTSKTELGDLLEISLDCASIDDFVAAATRRRETRG